MALLTARSSTIFIATGDHTRVYRSVEEVPPELRRQLQEITCGRNSGIILIADKRGREEFVRALEGEATDMPRRLAETLRARQTAPEPKPEKRLPLASLRTWLELLLPIAIGASLWFFVESRF